MNNSASFICVINDKSTTKYEESQCAIGNIAATLYKLDFGYYCMGPLGAIIFISIFGGIKQSYRWFILNQAIFDLLKCFEFSCENFLVNYVKPSPGCFYNGKGPVGYTVHQFIVNNIYSPLVLFSITRFIALYFIKLYDRLTRGYRIIFTILIFNSFFMIWDTEFLVAEYRNQRNNWLLNECKIKQILTNSTILCTTANTKDFFSDFLYVIYVICIDFGILKPTICLFFSSFATFMIILKVAKQAQFQFKHNRKDFLSSLRIAIVITSQTAMNLFIFTFQFLGNFRTIVSIFVPATATSNVPIVTNRDYVAGKNYTGYIDFRLPLWIDGPLGLTSLGGQQSITQIRIFIESFIVLCVMTGYREAIVNIFKKLRLLIKSPREFLKSFKKTTPNNSWT